MCVWGNDVLSLQTGVVYLLIHIDCFDTKKDRFNQMERYREVQMSCKLQLRSIILLRMNQCKKRGFSFSSFTPFFLTLKLLFLGVLISVVQPLL